MANEPHIQILRSPLGRAKGNGSAKSGVGEWKTARVSAIALVPLTLWLIISLLHVSWYSYADVVVWMSSPVTIALLFATIMLTFLHLQIGLQVVIEDYVHEEGAKTASLLLIKGACFILALLCIVSVAKVGFFGVHS